MLFGRQIATLEVSLFVGAIYVCPFQLFARLPVDVPLDREEREGVVAYAAALGWESH